jgi:hypothetical protein
MTTHEMVDNRHELLRDTIELAIRSAIRKQDTYEVCEDHERYTYTEVSWALAHVIHDVLRFGPGTVEMTEWADVEQFIDKLRLTEPGTRYDHDGKPPWLGRPFDPRVDNRSIPWFYEDK